MITCHITLLGNMPADYDIIIAATAVKATTTLFVSGIHLLALKYKLWSQLAGSEPCRPAVFAGPEMCRLGTVARIGLNNPPLKGRQRQPTSLYRQKVVSARAQDSKRPVLGAGQTS